MHTPSVVRVETLAQFQAEISAPATVRLTLYSQLGGQYPTPVRHYTLTLQGHNDRGELLWLTESRTVGLDPTGHKPWTALGIALEAQIEVWRSLVQTYLETAGYDVRRGGYALPDSYCPLDAVFECVRWQQEGNTVTVSPVG